MPTYSYRCEDCHEEFTVIMTVAEHGETKVACPHCAGNRVEQLISLFTARTSRKS